MQRILFDYIRRSGILALILGAVLALASPVGLMAQRGQGGRSQGYSSGRSYGGGQRFASPAPSYRGGGYGGGYSRGIPYRGGYGYGYGGYSRGYYVRPYYGYGYGFSYGPSYCAPTGYYDRWGRWIAVPGCAVSPYVDPYGY